MVNNIIEEKPGLSRMTEVQDEVRLLELLKKECKKEIENFLTVLVTR